jgi:enterochelin esterase family protein
MDTARYVLGVMLVVGVPPAVVFWIIIHPLAGFWRRVGSLTSYTVVTSLCILIGWGVYRARNAVLGPDLGTNYLLFFPGALLYGASAWLSVLTKRQLSMSIFSGVPELAKEGTPGVLLQEGVYSMIRHPRYLSVIVGTTGFAMFVNYVGAYLMVLGTIPALYLVVLMEEKELAQRFGTEYEEYRSRVPAIFPRIGKRGVPLLLLLFLLSSPAAAQQGRVMESQSFNSATLEMDWEYSVYLPPGYDTDDRSYLTVYLLHGYSGNHTNWIRLGDAAFTADSLTAEGMIPPVILIMPDGRNSFYVDSDPIEGFGGVETALVRDLVDHVDATYRTHGARRGRMIAGLSMGGYGAIHLAFKYPEVFGAAASLSGALPMGEPEQQHLFSPAFGVPFDPARWEEESPYRQISRVKESGVRLPVFLTVGDDDSPWLYEGAVDFYTALLEAEMPAELRMTDGPHSWEVWDHALKETLTFFSQVFRARYR